MNGYVLKDGIVYFPGAIKDIDRITELIESTNGNSVSPWETWVSGSNANHIYGDAKTLSRSLYDQDTDKVLSDSMFIIETLTNVMVSCASEYREIYDLPMDRPVFWEKTLRRENTVFGINKYNEGSLMGPHVDYDKNNTYVKYTIVCYLNDNYTGGELNFPNHGITIKPEAGSVMMYPSGDPYMHECLQITKGRKMIITHHLRKNHYELVEQYLDDVKNKRADSYMLTVARDGEEPVRTIVFYSNAIEAAEAYNMYQDWGFAKQYLTVSLYEPSGKINTKVFKRNQAGDPTFLRQNYIDITDVLNGLKPFLSKEVYEDACARIMTSFAKDNWRFDSERFLEALGLQSYMHD